jgi:hypothetical protein
MVAESWIKHFRDASRPASAAASVRKVEAGAARWRRTRPWNSGCGADSPSPLAVGGEVEETRRTAGPNQSLAAWSEGQVRGTIAARGIPNASQHDRGFRARLRRLHACGRRTEEDRAAMVVEEPNRKSAGLHRFR